MSTFQISDFRFATGLQCHKRLWWTTHDPDAPELVPDPAIRLCTDEELRVMEMARAHFPNGLLIDLPQAQVQERVRATELALAQETPAIFQATFAHGGLVVSVDILAREGRGHALIHVRSSTSVEPHHLWDPAAQAWVLRQVGIDVDSVEIMHLNPASRFPEVEDLFVREAVTGRVRALNRQIPGMISEQTAMLDGPLPEVAPGRHCNEPEICPFKNRCWPALPMHHVETFHALRREKSEQLDSQGLSLVEEVPSSFPLTVIQQRQQRSVTEGELQVEGRLEEALSPLRGRVAYLDMETVSLSVPVWNGFGPWRDYPVQFSCHVLSPDGELKHHDWLASGPEDSRVAMAGALVEAMEDADVVVAYDMKAKKKCLEAVAAAAPEQARQIQSISSRLRNLFPIVRDHVYHPDFRGSFSLDSVVPALLPEFGNGAGEIQEGHTHDSLLHELLFRGKPEEPAQRETIRQSLKRLAFLNSLALLRLKERLDELAEAQESLG
ncbi:MAG: DUF2779 domain-containing protein [Gemmatimonadota bacterium]